jgi:aconitase B
VAVALGRGASPIGTSGTGVALAPEGGKPGGVMVETTETTGKVIAVDANKRKVTFALPDGTIKTVKAGTKVDISAVRIGDDVTVQLGEGLAITVEKS